MDFKFLEDELLKRWVILAPGRSKRPNASSDTEVSCPFCVGTKTKNIELYRTGEKGDGWSTKVLANKYPFAPIHEVIIHSPDHHKTFDELPLQSINLIVNTYKNRFLEHKDSGQVCIFYNHGESAGESLPHPHSQLVVIPNNIILEHPHHEITDEKIKETDLFQIFCPKTSQWPDEVWLYPKSRNRFFGDITEEEVQDFSRTLYKIIKIMDIRHGHEFPYNFYIYPKKDWYLRFIPRLKTIGAFEVSTNLFVNTQDPSETIEFILEHFDNPDEDKIKSSQKAEYRKHI